MITSKKTDGTYGEIGFIKAKQEDGSYKDIEYQYDNKGNLIFEKGFTRSKEGVLPLVIDGIGKPLKDYDIYGNTYQSDGVSPDTPQEVVGVGERTGNLFNGEIQQGSLTDANGSEGNHTTRVRTSAVSVKPNETYTISSNLLLRNIILLRDGVFVETVPCYETVVSAYTFTVPDNANQVRASFRGNSAGDMEITPNDLEWLMLNIGSTPLPYEPYGYKEDVVTRGKNQANISAENWKLQNADTTVDVVDNKITINGVWFAYIIVPVTANTNYTFQYVCESYTKKNLAAIFGVKNDVMNSSDPIVPNAPSGKTFNSGERTEVALLFYASDSLETGVSVYSNIQLELGSTVTPYEPYTPPITTTVYLDYPLYTSENYVDSLNYKEQLCERNVKELVLTGEENWQIHNDNTKVYQFYTDLPTGKTSISGLSAYSNIVGYGATANNRNEYEFGCYPITSGTQIAFQMQGAKEQFVGISDWKSYLAAQYAAGTPVTVYYVLAEPETETVELPEVPTLDGTTVIDVDTEVKPSNMWVEYKSSTSEYNPITLRTIDNQALYTADNEILQTRR